MAGGREAIIMEVYEAVTSRRAVRGFKGLFPRHVRIARIAFPIWLYVSITGVIVYFMLYQWFPHS